MMELYIRSFLLCYNLYDSRHRRLGKVCRDLWRKQRLRVYDAGGHPVCTVWQQGESACVSRDGELLFCRPFRHRTASGFRLRPPAAQSMEIPTPWGIFTLVQEEKRDFTLFQDSRKVGEIRRMLSPVKELRLTSPQEEPAPFGGSRFSLACLMLHDDDFETV